ncbi:DedA family protein [Arcanobacterium phocae]|uniref:DedA family protein n=1 Tax=Arcanobacterium phocae TaxID=131112 RepID=UPI001C0EF157|nr:VTT domain-containing protein [Arcanobacterium phocae]
MTNLIADISYFLSHGPLLIVFSFLCVVIFFRAQGTYWLGRYIAHIVYDRIVGHEHKTMLTKRFEAWLTSERIVRGIDTVQRRGWPVVTVSFLTVGFQTIANMSAGILRMPWMLYTAAMIPGGAAWATIYATIGWTVWKAAMASAAGSPWGVIVVVAILGMYGVFIIRRKRAGDDMIDETAADNDSTPSSLGNLADALAEDQLEPSKQTE